MTETVFDSFGVSGLFISPNSVICSECGSLFNIKYARLTVYSFDKGGAYYTCKEC